MSEVDDSFGQNQKSNNFDNKKNFHQILEIFFKPKYFNSFFITKFMVRNVQFFQTDPVGFTPRERVLGVTPKTLLFRSPLHLPFSALFSYTIINVSYQNISLPIFCFLIIFPIIVFSVASSLIATSIFHPTLSLRLRLHHITSTKLQKITFICNKNICFALFFCCRFFQKCENRKQKTFPNFYFGGLPSIVKFLLLPHFFN